MADEDAETEEAANEAADHQDDAESRNQQLMGYCLALEEEQKYLLENQRQLPGPFDSVLSYNEADVGSLCIDSEELDWQFAEMAMEDNNESPLKGINYDELYSFLRSTSKYPQISWSLCTRRSKRTRST